MLGDKKNNILIIIILSIILLLNVISFLQKDDSWKLETIKVGGKENMKIVKDIYQSPDYVQQQTLAIEQALAQINMVDQNFDDLLIEQNNEMMVDESSEMMLENMDDILILEE